MTLSTLAHATTPQDVIDFWFSEENRPKWYKKDPTFDEEIRTKFLKTHELAMAEELEDWKKNPLGALALVIVLDQFSRNMFRDLPKAFDSDAQALEISKTAIDKGFDHRVSADRQGFFYMPFMHSENLEDQKRCITLFKAEGDEKSEKYAILHRDIIERFGRFPHRNKILGRRSTPEEIEFLTQPNSSF